MDLKKKLNRKAKRQVTLRGERVSSFVETLQTFLERTLREVVDQLPSDGATIKEAAKVLGGLESALKDKGLDARFGKLATIFQDEFDLVAEEFLGTTGKDALLSGFTRKNINAFVDQRLLMASSVVSGYVDDVRSIVLDAVVSGKKINAKDIVQASEGKAISHIETEINTTLMAYQRILHKEKAKKAGITKFLYVGPDDAIIRPFCQEHVDGIYTDEEIAEMDNGMSLPVEIYCGGYNCRHHWRPVSDELAAELEAEGQIGGRGKGKRKKWLKKITAPLSG